MDTPEIIYHYTDAEGLLGILNSKQIWATSYRYMNDAQEFYYGFDLIPELYPGQLPFRDLDFLGQFPELSFAEFIRQFKGVYDLDILFVASFSGDGDLLSQWRAYAGLHSGYSLGFSLEDLKAVNPETRLEQCCYKKEQQKKELKELIDKYFSIAKKEITSVNPDPSYVYPYIARFAALPDALMLFTKFKHKTFEDEKEWRLVVGPLEFNDKRICYRPGDQVIIPYVKIDFTATGLPLKRIIVGPGPHKERNRQSLIQMLKTRYPKIDVRLSEVPFRNW